MKRADKTCREKNHKWLDQNGWEHRKCYLQDINGNIYETTLNIAKARDGRNILYALSNTKKIDDGVVPSASYEEGLAHKHLSNDNISQDNPIVNSSISRDGEGDTRNFEGDVVNEQARNSILSGDGGWAGNESAGEQAGKLQAFKQRNQGKTEAERKGTAKKLFAEGKTRQEIIDADKSKIQINIVDESAYDNDMQSTVDGFKEKGIEVALFIGKGENILDNKKTFEIDGAKIGNKVYLRYDGVHAPQTLGLHELIHTDWETAEVQTIKDTILNSLSDMDKREILNQQRYLDYAEIYEDSPNKEDLIWEEFVADTLAGMNEYTENYIDLAEEYWNGREAIDIYSPNTYTESIDAGGTKAIDTNIEDRLIFIEESDIPYRERVQLREYIMQKNNSSKSLPETDCTEIGDNFYMWENISRTEYKPFAAIQIEGNEDIIDYLRSGIDNVNRSGQRISNVAENVIRRYRESDRSSIANENRRAKSNDGRISNEEYSRGQINADGRRNSIKSDGDSEVNTKEVSYSTIDNEARYSATMPKGEKPARDVDMPARDKNGGKVSHHIRTVAEAGATPDSYISPIMEFLYLGYCLFRPFNKQK